MWNPLGHEVLNETATWHPEPDTRGTWSILSSCIITLGLAVWTAVHLNIPGHETSSFAKFWRKVQWVLLGLFAPELVNINYQGCANSLVLNHH
jgi:hypothetical protein